MKIITTLIFSLTYSCLTCQIKILFIADAHITSLPTDQQYKYYSDRIDKYYSESNAINHFDNLLKIAKTQRVNYLFLLGDIINNPSESNINLVKSKLDHSGMRYYFISGNHDYLYEGIDFNLIGVREIWIDKLKPLYHGQNPLNYSAIINGYNFVFIDNSTNQVTTDQLFYFKMEIMKCLPIFLIMHIPIYSDGLNWPDHFTMGNPQNTNSQSTIDFIKCVKDAPNVISVISGHTHSEKRYMLSDNLIQMTVGPCLRDQYLLIELNSKR